MYLLVISGVRDERLQGGQGKEIRDQKNLKRLRTKRWVIRGQLWPLATCSRPQGGKHELDTLIQPGHRPSPGFLHSMTSVPSYKERMVEAHDCQKALGGHVDATCADTQGSVGATDDSSSQRAFCIITGILRAHPRDVSVCRARSAWPILA